MRWQPNFDYAISIQYVFENGENIEFEQYRTKAGKRERHMRYQDADGKLGGCCLTTTIWDNRIVFAIVGALRQQFKYPMYKSYIDFQLLRMRMNNLSYGITATPTACFFMDVETNEPCCPLQLRGEALPTMVHLVGKNEAGSLQAILRIIVDMLSEYTGNSWLEEEFTL